MGEESTGHSRIAGPSGSQASDAAEVNNGSFPIVGIGMSAGGLEVASAFLKTMPPDSGMGFVIVQHLDPTHDSILADLLGRETAMPVVQIDDGMRVEPNRVYVIVPAKTLLIEKGILRLVEPRQARGHRHPIDDFFTSLALDRKEKAITIVLSGAGSNGSAGIQDIKQGGGMCIAQDPDTARFDSMPRHAIATDAVDLVLPPEQMPEALIRYARHSYVNDRQPKTHNGLESDGKRLGLDDVLTLLQARAGQDFRLYKSNTLTRRIHRRMGLAQVEKLDDYVARLADDTNEVGALIKDLLINVTAFFRDNGAWEALDRDVITPPVENAETGQAIRVWVPACSTGEESYTIAMLLAERSAAVGKQLAIKIFATDAVENHLSAARRATFPGSMVESLSSERLTRFFDKVDDNYYRVKPELREMVLFAPQNLLKDPPYSKMDLVSCRNLLIYLEPAAQDKVLSLAHFALREQGYLFLGNAETVGQRDHLFVSLSKRWRIYRRIGGTRSTAIDHFNWRPRDLHGNWSTARSQPADIAVKSLAERFGPASVLIDRNYRVLHFHGRTDDYLTLPTGSPTLDVLALARDGLSLTIRGAVRKAIEGGQTVSLGASVIQGKANTHVQVTACPVEDGMVMVSFVEEPAETDTNIAHSGILQADSQSDQDFEAELRVARDEMRSNIEQAEITNEELTAANEEITSINEELQATNEELEASKEELQSLNEELISVNAQLDRKVAELVETGDDLRNLLIGNEVATIVLDVYMRIKWFSPGVRTLFNLVDTDVGRPLIDFSPKFAHDTLLQQAQAAVAELTKSEQEVHADNGRHYLLRVLPYRTQANQIAGAAATFIDITDLKKSEARITGARDYAEAIIKTVRIPLLVLTANLRVLSANDAFYTIFKFEELATTGQLVYELGEGDWNITPLRNLLEEIIPAQQQITDFEIQLSTQFSGTRTFLLNASRIINQEGHPALILLALEDITHHREAVRYQSVLVGELNHRVKNMLTVVLSIATQTRRHSATPASFYEAFQGRLQALAGANDAVVEGSWKGVELVGIVERALKPFGSPNQVTLSGDANIVLPPQASLALAMILHELATNATKYGALSLPAGSIKVNWLLDTQGEEQRVMLDWTESGGPNVETVSRRGEGTKFIERSITYELGGKATLNFNHDGLRANLTFPLTSAMMPLNDTPKVSNA